MTRILLQARQLLADACAPVSEGGVLVVGGRVAKVLRSARELGRVARAESLRATDLGDVLLAPGLVDAHAHLELGSLAGRLRGSGSFASWIARLIELRAPLRTEDFERAVRSGADRLLATGTTAVADVSSSGASERVFGRHALRAVVQREVLDANSAARTEAALERVRRALPRRSRRLEALSPHAPYTVSAPLLARLATLAARRRIGVAIHWAETEEEVRWLHDGSGPFAVLLDGSPRASGLELIARAGLLEGRDPSVALSLVHGNHPEPGDLERVARARAVLVHCPGTHAFFGRAPFPIERWLAAGATVALGTDSLASNADQDLAREMALLRRACPALAPARVLELATLGGASALGASGAIGTCAAGAWADLAAWAMPPGEEPLDALTSGAARLEGAWIAGRRVH